MTKFNLLLYLSIICKIFTFLNYKEYDKILLNFFCYSDLLFYIINIFSNNSQFFYFDKANYVINLFVLKQMLSNNEIFPYTELSVINSVIFLQVNNFYSQNFNINILFIIIFYLFCSFILLLYLLFYVNNNILKFLLLFQNLFLFVRILLVLVSIIIKID